MIGNPAQFEAIGNRLGFHAVKETPSTLLFSWQGARFPAFLCLGIALLLLFVSVPIVEALRMRGFVGPAGSLWYFPVMNLILFGISLFLISQRRTIEMDSDSRQITLRRQSLYRTYRIRRAATTRSTTSRLGIDQVYSGFAIGGSTAAESFPIPALRIKLASGDNVLLDRGSFRKLADIGKAVSERTTKPLEIDPQLQAAVSTLKSKNRGRERSSGGGSARDDWMELRDRFFDAFVSELLGVQPSHAALADITNRENIFAERFLRFVEARRPDHVAAPHIDQLQHKGYRRRAFGTPLIPDPLAITLHSTGEHRVGVNPFADLPQDASLRPPARALGLLHAPRYRKRSANWAWQRPRNR